VEELKNPVCPGLR